MAAVVSKRSYFALLAVVLCVFGGLGAGCHELDNLGGTTDYRLSVTSDLGPSLQAGTPVTIGVSMVDGLGKTKAVDRALTLELVRFGGAPLNAHEALSLSAAGTNDTRTSYSGTALRAGRFILRARAPNCTPWFSAPFDVFPAAPERLRFASPPQDAFGVDQQSVVVEVVDAFGNRVVDKPVDVTLGDVTGQTREGVVQFSEVTLDTTGENAVMASAPGLASASASVRVDEGVVGGRVTFAYVPMRYDNAFGVTRLDYEAESPRPIAGAPVLLLSGGKVVAETTSASNGSYRLRWPEGLADDSQVTLRVLAQTETPAVRVVDNTVTGGGALFALSSAPLVRSDFATSDGGFAGLNLHASSGWGGSGYVETRAAAPFALLDTMRRATEALVPEWASSLPLLTVYWSEANEPVAGDASKGQIGTSHFDTKNNALYILGAQDIDTDEYDVPVVVHEWGHFLVRHGLGRSDTIGGTHGGGSVLDPRTAFEEGLCNVLAAVAGMTPKPAYGDTLGIGQQGGFWEDLSRNKFYEVRAGWHSEESVQASVFDLVDVVDDSEEGWDDAALGWGGLLTALKLAREGGSYLSIFSLLDAVSVRFPEVSDSVEALSELHRFNLLEDGGWDANLPLFRPVGAEGDAVEVLMEAPEGLSPADGGAHASVNRWITFVGDGRAWEVRTLADRDVDVVVSQDGWPVVTGRSTAGEETVIVTTQPGARYVANVRSWDDRGSVFSTVVVVEPQVPSERKKSPPSWFGARASHAGWGPAEPISERAIVEPASPLSTEPGNPVPLRQRLVPAHRR